MELRPPSSHLKLNPPVWNLFFKLRNEMTKNIDSEIFKHIDVVFFLVGRTENFKRRYPPPKTLRFLGTWISTCFKLLHRKRVSATSLL